MMLRTAIAILSLCSFGSSESLGDCRGQTFGPEKSGHLSIMSWHIHYNTNTTGQRLLYEAFMKEFYDTKKLPFPPGTSVCPFGPNWGAASYPYVCSLEPPYEDWGGDNVVFGGPHVGGAPWSGPQRAFFFPNKYVDEAWKWIQANRFTTDVLKHPNSGCMHDDHSVRAHWVAEDPAKTPKIDITEFPCNVPETGCNDTLFGGPPACNCAAKLPLADDSPENSCKFCIANGGYVEDLTFACTDHPLEVDYQQIKYYNGKVSCGNLFLENDIGGGINVAPIVKFPFAKEGSLYTLVMMDPDADLPNKSSWPDVTTPGSHAPVRHWVIGNLDAKALRTGDFSQGTVVSPFKGPSPPYGSHRYGQFLFEQIEKFDFPDLSNESIVQWDYKGFLGMYALGDKLVASNWHITQHADPRSSAFEEREELERQPVKDLNFACTKTPLQVGYSHVKYYSGKVSCGSLLLENDIGGGINVAPIVTYPSAHEGTLYTLVMMDPDADLPNNGSWPDVKTPGSHAPVRHWVIGNLGAKALRTGDFSEGTVVSPFKGPSPPYGSHRYGQFLFRQPKKLDLPDLSGESIVQWDYKTFLAKYHLGDKPVASNWHITQHADPRSAAPEARPAPQGQLVHI